MREGIDYAWGDPGTKAIKAAGKSFVCRYVSTPGNPKNIRSDEARALLRAGIDVAIVFETTAGRALAGREAGAQDARKARQQIVAAGGPAESVVYFAVDFDATAAEQGLINAYLRGAASVLGKNNVGVYGGYWVVKRALDAGVCKYAWQTYAWSGGRWDPRAHIQQYKNGVRLNGVSVDLDRATSPDFGQWFYEPPAPPPVPPFDEGALPGPAHKPAWFWLALKQFLKNRQKGT